MSGNGFVCAGCLRNHQERFWDLLRNPIRQDYEYIIGQKVYPSESCYRVLCTMCAVLTQKYARFRHQCVNAESALQEIERNYRTSENMSVTKALEGSRKKYVPFINLTVSSITHYNIISHADVRREIDSHTIHTDNDVDMELKSHINDAVDYTSGDNIIDDSDDEKPLAFTRRNHQIKVEAEPVSVEFTKKQREDKTHKKYRKKEPEKKKIKTMKKKKEVRVLIKEKKEDDISVRDVENFSTLTVLTHEEQVAEIEKRKESSNYQNSPYKCEFCYKGFIDNTTSNNHRKKHEPESGAFECGVCRVRCATAHRLRGHVTAVHARKYSCNTCNFVCSNANQALVHEKWHRGVRHPCQFCDKVFSKWSSRLSHERLRHRSQFVCSECGDAFVSRLGLQQHSSRAHKLVTEEKPKEDKRLYCSECDLHFSTSEALARHTLTSDKHGLDSTMTTGCRRCGVVFTSEAAWTEHAQTHAERGGRVRKRVCAPRHGRVLCQECGKEFEAAAHCMAHYKSQHPGVKYPAEFVCETCGRKCKNRAVLLYHQRTHTGERPYPCHVCGSAFKHQSNLRRHSRVHTGEKLFECQICYKRFTQKVGMEMHVRTVHDKQPYPRRRRASVRHLPHAPQHA